MEPSFSAPETHSGRRARLEECDRRDIFSTFPAASHKQTASVEGKMLRVSLPDHARVLNVRLCESGRLSEWAQRVSATPGHIAFCAHSYYSIASPSVPLVSNISSQFVFLFSVHPHIIPSVPPFSLPAAQSYHTGSLFLANLSLIHYWDLFFFLESQNEEKGTDLLNFWCGAWKM